MNNEWHKYDMHLYRDSFQNYKVYQIPKAQLIIADVPYNLGTNAYGSNPSWYVAGDNKNGESDKAGKKFFNSENEFRPAEFMHFCSKMLVKEPKESGKAPCMILFCEFEQQFNCEYGLIFYRNKLPKFNNNGKMIFNCMDWQRDTETPKIHPTQKPVQLLQRLISIFSDEGELVIDPVCGSGSTLLAAQKMSRKSYGFEVDRNFFNAAKDSVLSSFEPDMFQMLKYENTIMNPPYAGG